MILSDKPQSTLKVGDRVTWLKIRQRVTISNDPIVMQDVKGNVFEVAGVKVTGTEYRLARVRDLV